MFSSNGVSCITETEARLGDVLARAFPREGQGYEPHMRAKARVEAWAAANGVRILSFWDYSDTKRAHPELHLAPTPHPGNTSSGTFLAFDEDLATKVLFLGFVPEGH